MYKIVLFTLLLASSFSVTAQYAGFSPVTNLARFKAEFAAATQKTGSIKSDFEQDKNLAMLSEKITSRGNFWFKKDSRVRMEYKQPFKYLMILNKDKVFVKDGQKETKVSTRSNKIFQQINKIMIDCMQGTTLDNTDFKTRVFENKTSALVELTPLTKGMKEMFTFINVIVDKKDFSVSSIQMQEISGDNTIMRFTNKELNVAIPDNLFDIK
ncbi:MAG: outer membrane lipoprotein carrier protein LolA [Chitinophagaceae bacterium]|nr:outer membrane lipoprotein carrier protein LolA [Chitinophagaceae bacterium]MBK7121879.1 outer membrane lipoprotein carrier protein LolA [Chitinophagaceae bacterium]MBK7558270.1 outer membrane lipoprotein carrier protein LolA [Chitinophagaceae bacterium]MBK9531973.1 outer membrane lipoprotein carrier protein LolA [Chitinophagaceae bacterium]